MSIRSFANRMLWIGAQLDHVLEAAAMLGHMAPEALNRNLVTAAELVSELLELRMARDSQEGDERAATTRTIVDKCVALGLALAEVAGTPCDDLPSYINLACGMLSCQAVDAAMRFGDRAWSPVTVPIAVKKEEVSL